MIGIIDFLGFESGGLSGWWEAVQNQTPNAPLLPALTSIVLIVKPGVLEGFGVLIAFAALLTLATYGIGERLAGPRLGALAALAVGTCQGVFVFTREYIFALPTAAFLACSVYALIRSEGMHQAALGDRLRRRRRPDAALADDGRRLRPRGRSRRGAGGRGPLQRPASGSGVLNLGLRGHRRRARRRSPGTGTTSTR